MQENQANIVRPNFDENMNSATELSAQGNHFEALAIFAEMFSGGAQTEVLFEKAATSLVAILAQPARFNEIDMDMLRDLLLQRSSFSRPPALHHAIASAHSSGQSGILPNAAALLRPLLTDLWTEGRRDRGMLLMVLLLRSNLDDWQEPAAIRAWHLDQLPDFAHSDMAIPYNTMFDKKHFTANVDDLRSLVMDTKAEDLARRLGPWRIMLIQAITESKELDQVLPAIVKTWQAAGAQSDEDSASGARSLALRSLALGGEVSPAPVGNDVFFAIAAELKSGRRGRMSPDEGTKRRISSRPWQALNAASNLVRKRLPVTLPTRRPRIAICISGQLRGYRQAYATWTANFLRETDCTVFVHSWTRIGRSGAEPFRAFLPFEGAAFCAAYRDQAHLAGMDETVARYPSLFRALQDTGVVTEDELRDYYRTEHVVLEDDADDRFKGWPNSRKMHYKIASAGAMAEQPGSEFDLILRIRPDKAMGLNAFAWSDMVRATRDGATLYADSAIGHQYGQLLVGDQVALGSPSAMKAYADTYTMIPRLAEAGAFGCRSEFIGHVSLAMQCWHNGIDVRRLPVKTGSLLEAAPLDVATIAHCIEQDAAGRMDAMDKVLIEANRRDLSRS